MKRKFIMLSAIILSLVFSAGAQRISVRLDFPAGVHYRAPGPPPFRGAIWIGPEWEWRKGRYVYVPGYWTRPQGHGIIWVQGHWNYSRRGYIWIPGHWR